MENETQEVKTRNSQTKSESLVILTEPSKSLHSFQNFGDSHSHRDWEMEF